ncbi:MAG: hypothetical protein LBC84_06665 [Prevotellaceae bacterium]|jgi:phosphoribosylformylglycinamidine (FGAM) synthase-like enzyme|nr:hypothetical protein [Prevotellaceae bacterium]
MAKKTKDIIEIGDKWACALREQKGEPFIYCYYNENLIEEIPISVVVKCTPFNHLPEKEAKAPFGGTFSIDLIPEPKSLQRVATALNEVLTKSSQQSNAYILSAESNAPSLAIATGGNSRHTYDDPELANMVATAEASLNLASTGAAPVAFFKLPPYLDQRPHPTLGLVGLLPKELPQTTTAFGKKGEMIYLLGRSVEDIASSEYLYTFHNIHPSPPSQMNPKEQSRLQTVLVEAIRNNLITGIHSVTKGGVFFTLLESSMPNSIGFDITTDAEIREDAFLFGESLGRFIASVSEENDVAFVDLFTRNNVTITTLGHTTKGEIRVDDISYGFVQDYE